MPFAQEILLLLNVGADEHSYHTNHSHFKMKVLPGWKAGRRYGCNYRRTLLEPACV